MQHVTLAHGNGGRYMRELITRVFAKHLGNPLLDISTDAVSLPHADGEWVMTNDGFTYNLWNFQAATLAPWLYTVP